MLVLHKLSTCRGEKLESCLQHCLYKVPAHLCCSSSFPGCSMAMLISYSSFVWVSKDTPLDIASAQSQTLHIRNIVWWGLCGDTMSISDKVTINCHNVYSVWRSKGMNVCREAIMLSQDMFYSGEKKYEYWGPKWLLFSPFLPCIQRPWWRDRMETGV